MQTNTKNEADIQPLSEEEIKAIGEIQLGPAKHEIFLNQHYKKLIIGGCVLITVLMGTICYFSYQDQDRDAAAAQNLAALNGDPAKEATALYEVTETYPGTPAADSAMVMRGTLLLNEGDTAAEGVKILKEACAVVADATVLARAHASLATYYMTNGDVANATIHWQEITRLENTAYTALAHISLGDLAYEAGEIEKARGHYSEISKKFPHSVFVADGTVANRMLLLDVDAPRKVQPEADLTSTETPDVTAPALPDTTTTTTPDAPLTSPDAGIAMPDFSTLGGGTDAPATGGFFGGDTTAPLTTPLEMPADPAPATDGAAQ